MLPQFLVRARPSSLLLATGGIGLLAALPWLAGELSRAGLEGAGVPGPDLSAEIVALQAERGTLRDQLARTLSEVDRTHEAVAGLETRLARSLEANRDSVAYARQLETELSLRRGLPPVLVRSERPDDAAQVIADAAAQPSTPTLLALPVAPDLPDDLGLPQATEQVSFVDPESADLRRLRKQLARKSWDEVVMSAVQSECRGGAHSARYASCAGEVEGRLEPYAGQAQLCMAQNYGGTFYFDTGNRLNPPRNGILLDRGMVVFCDPDLRDYGKSEEG